MYAEKEGDAFTCCSFITIIRVPVVQVGLLAILLDMDLDLIVRAAVIAVGQTGVPGCFSQRDRHAFVDRVRTFLQTCRHGLYRETEERDTQIFRDFLALIAHSHRSRYLYLFLAWWDQEDLCADLLPSLHEAQRRGRIPGPISTRYGTGCLGQRARN
ncbi:hypothetical protein BCV70DRAFT_35509 [Testicularia cyperi]|uniref:Uncharacterized protein n=1 Tax=Testicularia cyperi TaxID=1882483 RepID=A0A317XJF2_9BASI|nr:hypothetical protein BCV70DRAFT_35509 [Testicularia cyperi]